MRIFETIINRFLISISFSHSYYAASSSTSSSPLLSTVAAGNNCGGGGGGGGGGGAKPSKRQKVSHPYPAKGGRNQNGGQLPMTGGQVQQQSHHAIVPDQLKLYSEYPSPGHHLLVTRPRCRLAGCRSRGPPLGERHPNPVRTAKRVNGPRAATLEHRRRIVKGRHSRSFRFSKISSMTRILGFRATPYVQPDVPFFLEKVSC